MKKMDKYLSLLGGDPEYLIRNRDGQEMNLQKKRFKKVIEITQMSLL